MDLSVKSRIHFLRLHIGLTKLWGGSTRIAERRLALLEAPKCDCSLRGRLVGDGCHICNPGYMLDHEVDDLPAAESDVNLSNN